jgi:hypothetical protein
LYVGKTGLQTAEGGKLLGDARRKGGCGAVFDIAEQMLNTDFFCLFTLDC